MEFGLIVTDIPVYVPCKFEMYIFKVALVISENVRIAFLYVLSIDKKPILVGENRLREKQIPPIDISATD